jgi:hypothetical protein
MSSLRDRFEEFKRGRLNPELLLTMQLLTRSLRCIVPQLSSKHPGYAV